MTTYVRPQWRAASNVAPAKGPKEVSGVGRQMRVRGLSMAQLNMLKPGLALALGITS